MDARTKILGRIRAQKNRDSLSADEKNLLETRIKSHQKNLIPKRGQIPLEDQISLFVEKIEGLQATVDRVKDPSEIPEKIRDYLKGRNLPGRIKVTPSKEVSGLDWSKTPNLELIEGAGAEEDEVGLSPAFAAIAESGTLMMASGPDTPSTVNFLPENHIVVLDISRMRGSYEEAWDLLREKTADKGMPRTVNFISGPSRTADIEQTLIMGAHGPKSLHVILVGDGAKG
ncbi:LutC/YkgG family protein [Sneathiella limimaris]|uniref:LutC/YkgG family protein n=1 Tax=Sneathiella limimaris TaxID=1964213 RepID=UPI00146F90FB|nr:lactate utilization protein [Sneathiella limimaris]